jgi:hypothetical protein
MTEQSGLELTVPQRRRSRNARLAGGEEKIGFELTVEVHEKFALHWRQ